MLISALIQSKAIFNFRFKFNLILNKLEPNLKLDVEYGILTLSEFNLKPNSIKS